MFFWLGRRASQWSCRSFTTLGGVSDSMLVSLSMNYNNSGSSQHNLVANLQKNNIIKSKAVFDAMNATDRKDFLDEGTTDTPWKDVPVSIGSGATISSPHMHAIALEALEPALQPGSRALDIGCGSGYLTVCMAHMVGKSGSVLGMDHAEALVAKSRVNANKHLPLEQLSFMCASPFNPQGPSLGPFDAIHCGAAAMKVPPILLKWLAPGGSLLIPVSKHGRAFAQMASAFTDSALSALTSTAAELGEQELLLVSKAQDGSLSSRSLMTVIYSPLSAAPPQPPLPIEDEHELTRQLDAVQAQLQEWQRTYKLANNVKPSSSVMAQDPVASPLLASFAQLTTRRKRAQRAAQQQNKQAE